MRPVDAARVFWECSSKRSASAGISFSRRMIGFPREQGLLIDDKSASAIREFLPRIEVLEVRLPGNSLALNARTIREAANADVALIKIDPPDPMNYVPLARPDLKPALGEPITVIGYPEISTRPQRSVLGSSAVGCRRPSINPWTDCPGRNNLKHQRRSRAEGAERDHGQLRRRGLSAHGECNRSGQQRRTGIR